MYGHIQLRSGEIFGRKFIIFKLEKNKHEAFGNYGAGRRHRQRIDAGVRQSVQSFRKLHGRRFRFHASMRSNREVQRTVLQLHRRR